MHAVRRLELHLFCFFGGMLASLLAFLGLVAKLPDGDRRTLRDLRGHLLGKLKPHANAGGRPVPGGNLNRWSEMELATVHTNSRPTVGRV